MAFCRRSRLDRIEQGIRSVLTNQINILRELHYMSTNPPITQEQFAADLAQLKTDLGSMIADVQSDINQLKAEIANGQPPDFSALDATVQQLDQAVNAEDTSAKADQAPPAPAPAA